MVIAMIPFGRRSPGRRCGLRSDGGCAAPEPAAHGTTRPAQGGRRPGRSSRVRHDGPARRGTRRAAPCSPAADSTASPAGPARTGAAPGPRRSCRTRPGTPLHGQLVRRERAVLAAVRIPDTPQLPADRGRTAARPLRDRPHPGPRRAQVGDLHPFPLRQVPVRDLPPDHSPPRDHGSIMQLPAVPGGDRTAVSPPFPGPRVDPDDPARLQAAEPLPDQPCILLPLLRPAATHPVLGAPSQPRNCRVLPRPLESVSAVDTHDRPRGGPGWLASGGSFRAQVLQTQS